jgi:capsular polysaccharide export protein
VPGQVESDASIRFATPGIRTNIALLQTVRAVNPDAYVVYKPHPDVLAGLRAMGDGENAAFAWCNEVVMEASMANMLTLVDEVHVLTSLAGFEALLRGRAVTTYGQPFYAGWGLTCDMAPIPRRTRHLTLSELVAGVLILYPTYISRATGCFTTPEQALDELLAWRETVGDRLPLWHRILRPFLRLMSDNV